MGRCAHHSEGRAPVPARKNPDKDGYSLVLFNCFSGKKFDALRTELNRHLYDRVSGLLYYLVGLTAPEGGLKQAEVVPEPVAEPAEPAEPVEVPPPPPYEARLVR